MGQGHAAAVIVPGVRFHSRLACLFLTWLCAADGAADATNVTLTITNTSMEFTKLGRCVLAGILVLQLLSCCW
jgi:hypothetical protein